MTGLEIKLMKKRATDRRLNVNSLNVNNIHHLLLPGIFFVGAPAVVVPGVVGMTKKKL